MTVVWPVKLGSGAGSLRTGNRQRTIPIPPHTNDNALTPAVSRFVPPTLSRTSLPTGIAGLWATYEGDETIQSCTMLTTNANELVKRHRTGRMRMPVVLDEAQALQWLDPNRTDFADVLRPVDVERMKLL